MALFYCVDLSVQNAQGPDNIAVKLVDQGTATEIEIQGPLCSDDVLQSFYESLKRLLSETNMEIDRQPSGHERIQYIIRIGADH